MDYYKICEVCGKKYHPIKSTQVACSKKCSNAKYNRVHQGKSAEQTRYMKKVHKNDRGVVDCAKEAKKLGMSYGYYMAMKSGMI